MDECFVPEKMLCFFCWCYYFYFLFQTLFLLNFSFRFQLSKALSMYLPWHSSFLLNLLMAHFNFMRQLLCANVFQKKGSKDDNIKGNTMMMMKKKKKKHWKTRTSVVIIFIIAFYFFIEFSNIQNVSFIYKKK